mmetsp:Transcript_40270/g.110820  ORF Transcript_40270/g.110820 Transcript_40270/m.110820 type:complete len:527 (-) Transcript_40270:5-1585(-)
MFGGGNDFDVLTTLRGYSDDVLVPAIANLCLERPSLYDKLLQSFELPPDAEQAEELAEDAQGPGVTSRFVGTIKKFDTAKGFGFIDCPELHAQFGRDVWVIDKQLNGFDVGAQVSFAATLNDKGQPQAQELQDASNGDVRGKASPKGCTKGMGKVPMFQDKEMGKATEKGKGKNGKSPEMGRYVGCIKKFDFERHHGFIECPEIHEQYGRDVFLSEAQTNNFTVGAWVSFTMTLNKHGQPQAQNLQDASMFDHALPKEASSPWVQPVAPTFVKQRPPPAQEGRYEGTIKRFDVEKHHGFIECPELMQQFGRDVFLSEVQMGCFSVGSKVSFNVTFNKNGHPQAQDLQEVGHARMSQKRSATEMSFDSQYQGVVKKIDFEKGFGFIECQDLKEQFGRDVWVGSEQLGNFGVGSPVAFSVHVNQHGPQAHGLQPIDESVAAEATQRYEGTIKKFDPERHHGFIDCPELMAHYGRDTFLSESQIAGFTVGSWVSFRVTLNQNGQPQAQDLAPGGEAEQHHWKRQRGGFM